MRALLLCGTALAQLYPNFEYADEDAVEAARSQILLAAGLEAEAPSGIQSPSLCDPSVKQHSGYLDADGGAKYFFWLFESKGDPAKDPLVMWLNGGPGCSSILGLFSENGPCKVNADGSGTTPNPYSWNAKANVIYVDQPAATGFSTGLPTTHDEDGVASNMLTFLNNFFKELPQYKANDFYIFGESYGGHYVPAIGHAVWQNAKDINFKGIGVGNGLVNPEEQYKWYAEMALNGGRAEGGSYNGSGVITSKITQGIMRAAVVPCVAQVHACNANPGSQACSNAYLICNYGEQIPYQLTGMNPYDVRKKCEVPPLCYDFSKVETYLNTASVQTALGVTKKWGSCNRLVNMLFQKDFMRSYHDKIPDLLANGKRVLIYAGDMDYICNWIGNKHWTLALDWPHKTEFNAAADTEWTPAGASAAAGKLRTSNGFSFLQVFNAGHMVPLDQPLAAQVMLNDFIADKLAAPEALVV
jgi:cathepsin A (carboxypeptidase C)